MTSRIVVLSCLLLSASGLISPPAALALGLLFGLAMQHPYPAGARRISKWLLQASVVGLGFGMNLHEVLHAGRHGFVYTMLGIAFALAMGMALGRILGVKKIPAFLISTGTAICGGSAIAAVGPITKASDEEMSISLGTVFVLNSVALLTFPFVGGLLHLSQSQFGLWAALAIHDTSSVVGAAAKYGSTALSIATTVKLARALWIVPVALATAIARGAKARIEWPWFIGLFCLAAVCSTYLPAGMVVYAALVKAAKMGLTATLFLIGSGITVATLKRVGHRPLLQGVILWLIVLTASLWFIRVGWISL
jgi:uncharacterized integral membrane protein (TIGR00698 family)